MDLEERSKKNAKHNAEYMESVGISVEEALAIAYREGYWDCISDHDLTAVSADN